MVCLVAPHEPERWDKDQFNVREIAPTPSAVQTESDGVALGGLRSFLDQVADNLQNSGQLVPLGCAECAKSRESRYFTKWPKSL